MKLSFETNSQTIAEHLAGRTSALLETLKQILKISSREIGDSIRRKLTGEVLKTGSGALLRSIKVSEDLENLKISIESSGVPYATVHEFGTTIRATKEKFLTFQVRPGAWRRVKSVNIPARPFFYPALKENLSRISEISKRAMKENFL